LNPALNCSIKHDKFKRERGRGKGRGRENKIMKFAENSLKWGNCRKLQTAVHHFENPPQGERYPTIKKKPYKQCFGLHSLFQIQAKKKFNKNPFNW
jgi:hypothetical protein